MAKQSIWNATLDPNNRIDVNSFDWSHYFHSTFDLGTIYPLGFFRCPPKSSIRCNLETGIQMFQTVFPLQTPLRLRINAFKVELRALDNDYMERTVGNSDTLEPYIDMSNYVNTDTNYKQFFGTSSLWDYLGLPTRYVSYVKNGSATLNYYYSPSYFPTVGSKVIFGTQQTPGSGKSGQHNIVQFSSDLLVELAEPSDFYIVKYILGTNMVVDVTSITVVDYYTIKVEQGYSYFLFTDDGWLNDTDSLSNSYYKYTESTSEYSVSNTPYKDADTAPNAYSARAYEAIYNSFYRDTRNNPRLVNGKPVYNTFIPNNEPGADTYPYMLHRCNWQPDMFTTAVPDPQQGVKAPLAGLTTYTTQSVNDLGETVTKVNTAIVDEDGKTYGIDFKSNEEGTALTEVTYTELNQDPQLTKVNSLLDLATSGLSIETLRQVNAYQKYLELNMRKGYLYKDIIQGRWDISIRYDELLMPEFIGGISKELNVNAVTQTVDNDTNGSGNYADALGSQSGIAGVYGYNDNTIQTFCDEESIIMFCLTITPSPIYTQYMSKWHLYRKTLDSFQPEFDNIGFQAIPKTLLNPSSPSIDTFGYQRPWYEYCEMMDTAHGDFRTSLSNFLMKRTFSNVPELSQDFLLVDPDQVNDVYAVSKVDDQPILHHFYGFVRFDMTAKLPITRVAIPRLD